MVKAFGDKVFDVIEAEPDRLKEVDGIGPIRAQRIISAWAEQKVVREIMVFLHSHGVGTARAVRIFKTYGADAIQVMTENPYRLARDIRGIGFKTADAIAMKLGIEKTAMKRSWKNDDSLWRNHLLPAFGRTKVPSLTVAQVGRFHAEHQQPVTANRALEVLRISYRLARSWGWTTTDPTDGIQKHVEEKRRHYFPTEHLTQLEEALSIFEMEGDPVRRRFALMIRLLLLTGCRLREIMLARRSWVIIDRGWIVVPYAAHKTGGKKKEDKVVVLSDRSLEIVRTLLAESNNDWLVSGADGGALSGYRKMWLDLLEQAGLPHYRVHDLRHTFATYAITHGAGLETVKALLGHASIQSTERYAYVNSKGAAIKYSEKNWLPRWEVEGKGSGWYVTVGK